MTEWKTSSFSGGGDCLEVKFNSKSVLLRDTKTGGIQVYNHGEWDAFLKGVKAGEFDFERVEEV